MASNHPSYFPPDTDAPPSLIREDAFWTTGENLVLSTESATALVEAKQYMEALQESGILQQFGLDTSLDGGRWMGGHCTRAAVFGLLVNDKLKAWGSKRAGDPRILALAAMIHDIGKMHPDIHKIIMSPRRLTPADTEAWDLIKRHPALGSEVVLQSRLEIGIKLSVAAAVYQHHERPRGGGYYHFLANRLTPEARLLAYADTVDAMLAKRPYKPSLAMEKAMQEIGGRRFRSNFGNHMIMATEQMYQQSGALLLFKN